MILYNLKKLLFLVFVILCVFLAGTQLIYGDSKNVCLTAKELGKKIYLEKSKDNRHNYAFGFGLEGQEYYYHYAATKIMGDPLGVTHISGMGTRVGENGELSGQLGIMSPQEVNVEEESLEYWLGLKPVDTVDEESVLFSNCKRYMLILDEKEIVSEGFVKFFNTMSVAPYTREGNAMVTMHSITMMIAANVSWDGEENSKILISDYYNSKIIELKIDSKVAIVDGQSVKLSVAPELKNETLMVPLKFIVEQFGGKVEWYEEHKGIEITIPPVHMRS